MSSACSQSEREADDLGSASQAISSQGSDHRLFTSNVDIHHENATAAWITRANNPGSTQALGTALVGYTREDADAGLRAAFTFSLVGWNANLTTPWAESVSVDGGSGGTSWPIPSNLCDTLFGFNFTICGGSIDWRGPQGGRYARVVATLSTNLRDVGALVVTGANDQELPVDEHLYLLGVTVAGLTAPPSPLPRKSLQLTVPAEDSEQTWGEIDYETVAASTMFHPFATTRGQGHVAVPIYVVWEAGSGGRRSWWFTRAVVGEDGLVTQTTLPTPLEFIPLDKGAEPNVFGYIDPRTGRERVGIVWSERDNPFYDCQNSNDEQPTTVTWHVVESDDFFRTERCFRGTDPKIPLWPDYFTPCGPIPGNEEKNALLYQTQNWKQCIEVRNQLQKNSARVEVGVNMITAASTQEQTPDVEDTYFYFALNAPEDATTPGGHRIHLFRTGGSWANVDPLQVPIPNDTATSFVPVAVSKSTLPTASGSTTDYGVGDAFAQALAIHQGRFQDQRYPRVAVSYRTTDDDSRALRMAVLQHESRLSTALSLQYDDSVTTDVSSTSPPEEVPFAVDRPLGLRTGIFAAQGWCDSPNCLTERFPYVNPSTMEADTQFLSVWTDGRDTTRSTLEVFGRSYKWE